MFCALGFPESVGVPPLRHALSTRLMEGLGDLRASRHLSLSSAVFLARGHFTWPRFPGSSWRNCGLSVRSQWPGKGGQGSRWLFLDRSGSHVSLAGFTVLLPDALGPGLTGADDVSPDGRVVQGSSLPPSWEFSTVPEVYCSEAISPFP